MSDAADFVGGPELPPDHVIKSLDEIPPPPSGMILLNYIERATGDGKVEIIWRPQWIERGVRLDELIGVRD